MVTASEQMEDYIKNQERKGVRGLESASKKSEGFRIADSEDLRFPSRVDFTSISFAKPLSSLTPVYAVSVTTSSNNP